MPISAPRGHYIRGPNKQPDLTLSSHSYVIVFDLMLGVTDFHYYKTFLSQALGPQKGYDVPGW